VILPGSPAAPMSPGAAFDPNAQLSLRSSLGWMVEQYALAMGARDDLEFAKRCAPHACTH